MFYIKKNLMSVSIKISLRKDVFWLHLCYKNRNATEMWKSHGIRKTFNEKEVDLLYVNKVYVLSPRQRP